MLSASAARCCLVLVPSLYPHAAACRSARPLTTVSAKPRRSSRGSRRERSWDDDGGGGSDSDIDDGFFGQDQDDEDPTPSPGLPASPAPQLWGSDVLRALQRAAAAKEASRNKKKDMKKPPARQRQGKEKPAGGDVDAREVRPVVVRPEWAARIRDLELRVQQLAADKKLNKQRKGAMPMPLPNPDEIRIALDEDGIAAPGQIVRNHDIYVNKQTPKAGNKRGAPLTDRDYKNTPATYKGVDGETTVVDHVMLCSDTNDKLSIKCIIRHTSRPEVGDKFSSRHGKKGVCGTIVQTSPSLREEYVLI